MKVKDLIKNLSEYKDQEMEVLVFDPHHPGRLAFSIESTSIGITDNCSSVLIDIKTYPSNEVGHE